MRKRLTKKYDRVKNAANTTGLRREITNDFKYDKKKQKHIEFVLHNVNVSLGALVSALGRFSKVKGPDISPDGMLGGLGYIMPIKDIKNALNQMVRDLSDIQDSLGDELTNPKWGNKSKETEKILKEKEKIEEKVEDMEEDSLDIDPNDVVTSNELAIPKTASIDKESEDYLQKAVSNSLVSFYQKK